MAKKQNREVNEEYLKAYYDNEANANKQMSLANAFGAFLMLGIWICYLTGAFYAHDAMKILINIAFPIGILILLTPLLYSFVFKKYLRKPHYKFFVVFSFVLVVAVLNVLLPRNSLIAWSLCVVMTNHYYNPKLGRITFGVIVIAMLLCLYGSLFIGEYDPNLLGVYVKDEEAIEVFGIKERYEMLHEALINGENHYLEVFLYNYLPRLAFITLIFIVCNALNMRTYKLLVDEINVNSDQQKTKTELEVAKEIQLASLPVEFTTNEDIEIQAELKPAKEVGGDFYDYFVLDDDNIAIVIGDVSGKGIPAAMFMMKTITCFKNNVSIKRSPSEILELVNKTIYQGNDSQMFVTCFFAIVNTKSGKVKFANAGHNPPIIGGLGHFHYLKCQSGFVLGVLENPPLKDEETLLEKGESITLYTDGMTEAKNNEDQLFGEERYLNVFNKKNFSCLLELHHQIKDEIAEFTKDTPQSDDMTYLTLKYRGDKCIYKQQKFTATQDNVPSMMSFLKDFVSELKIDQSFISNLMVVGDELLSNVVKYAYPDKVGVVFLRLLYNYDLKEIILTIIDGGEPFNPLEVNAKPIEGNVEDIKEGGLGILIVKKIMSEYAYDRINNKNIIILKKKL